MKVVIGSARIDENKRAIGGKAGDQTQSTTPDYRGEVSLQDFYVSSKGWYVIRPKTSDIGKAMSDLMILACNNVNIGYSQSDRYSILKKGIRTTTPTNCDCSSLVREIVKEATTIDPGDFSTANEAAVLVRTGLFDKCEFTSKDYLEVGDILVTKTKGHTAIVVQVPDAHMAIKYINNHIYTVYVDDLNVREKWATDNETELPTAHVVRKLTIDDKVTCIKSVTVKGQIWICLGINEKGREEWCCADTGRKAYIRR